HYPASPAISPLSLHDALPISEGACFWGFVARSGRARDDAIEALASTPGAAILYEAGNRTPALLRDLAEKLGDRRALIARELTKRSEEHTSELQSLTNLVCRLL